MAEDLQRIKVKSVSSSKSAHLMNHAPSVEAASWTILLEEWQIYTRLDSSSDKSQPKNKV